MRSQLVDQRVDMHRSNHRGVTVIGRSQHFPTRENGSTAAVHRHAFRAARARLHFAGQHVAMDSPAINGFGTSTSRSPMSSAASDGGNRSSASSCERAGTLGHEDLERVPPGSRRHRLRTTSEPGHRQVRRTCNRPRPLLRCGFPTGRRSKRGRSTSMTSVSSTPAERGERGTPHRVCDPDDIQLELWAFTWER